MSVTFYARNLEGQILAPEGFVQGWEDDPDYGRITTNQNPWELNVSAFNLMPIADIIGVPMASDYGTWGDGSLQDVKDKIKFALESMAAMPELDGGRPGGEIAAGEDHSARELFGELCTIIDCGQRDGYFTHRLTILASIVDAAIANGGTVTWC